MRGFTGIRLSALALVPALWACGMQAPRAHLSASDTQPLPIQALQEMHGRIETLPPTANVANVRVLQAEALTALDELATLRNSNDQAQSLERVRTLQFTVHKRLATIQDSTARTAMLQLWNDAVEMELVLRHVYAEQIMKKIDAAVGSVDAAALAPLVRDLATVGIGDFSGRLIDALGDTHDATIRSHLVKALAKSTRHAMASAWLYEAFLEAPSRELLVALVEAGLPTKKALEAFKNRKPGDAEWTGEADGSIKSSALDAIQFVAHTNPFGRRQEEEKKAREKEEIRRKVHDAVVALSESEPDAERLAEPLVGSFRPTFDAQGFYVDTRGLRLREGDVLLYRFTPQGYSWESFSNSPARFSHVAMVTFSPEGKPLLADQGYTTVDFTEMEEGLGRGMYSTLVRDTSLTAADRRKLRSALWEIASKPHGFDYRFNLSDSSKSYCAELIYNVYQRSGLPSHFPLYTFQNERAKGFMREMGVSDDTFVAPGSFPSDSRFAYLGHVYEHSSGKLVAARNAVDTLFNVLWTTKWADFSKAKGQTPVATVVDIYRIFNVGGLGIMSQNLARNVRSLDGSLGEVVTRIDRRLNEAGIPLENIRTYREMSERVAHEAIADVYEKAFRF